MRRLATRRSVRRRHPRRRWSRKAMRRLQRSPLAATASWLSPGTRGRSSVWPVSREDVNVLEAVATEWRSCAQSCRRLRSTASPTTFRRAAFPLCPPSSARRWPVGAPASRQARRRRLTVVPSVRVRRRALRWAPGCARCCRLWGGTLQVGDLTVRRGLGRRPIWRGRTSCSSPRPFRQAANVASGRARQLARWSSCWWSSHAAGRGRASHGLLRSVDDPDYAATQADWPSNRVVSGDPSATDPRRRAQQGEARGRQPTRMSRRALITGISGPGQLLLAELLNEGYEVCGMVRRA